MSPEFGGSGPFPVLPHDSQVEAAHTGPTDWARSPRIRPPFPCVPGTTAQGTTRMGPHNRISNFIAGLAIFRKRPRIAPLYGWTGSE